jgi:outer membrane protein TolC
MMDPTAGRFRPIRLAAGLALVASTIARGAEPPAAATPVPRVAQLPEPMPPPPIRPEAPRPLPPTPPSILDPNVRDIDLNTALRLAGVQNPQLLIARQRVVEAAALRQLAATFILPSINLGMNYDTHTGVLQQSSGNILSVNRSSLYVGAGAYAIAAGTVSIPGVLLTGNLAVGVYGYLASRQVVAQREFATVATRNQAFLATTIAYCELLRAEGRRAVAMQVRDDAKRVARLTAAYASAGQGRKSDADRAATELSQREADVQAAEGEILVASARLCEVLFLDPSIRLHPTDAWVVPHPIVPDPIPVAQLIALGLLNRPELGERRAAIREAMLVLDGAKVLPFSPNYFLGFSGGGFGGGSNLVRPIFGGFGGRSDLDAVAYWTIQNMGVGNLALINAARARLGVAKYQEIAVLDRVRAEVAEAYARTHARYAQIGTTERAVITATDGFKEDVIRLENTVGLPIELLDSLRLLARARLTYLDSIVDYNEAQFELFVALGQPPADMLARPVPTAGVVPPGQPIPVPPAASPAPVPPEPAEIRADAAPPPPAVAGAPALGGR